jgi:predicted secreted protein
VTGSSPIDHQSQIELHVGEKLTFDLPGLGSAGYQWSHELVGSPGVVDVSWSRITPHEAACGSTGLSSAERATVRAQAPGQVTLRLVQRRPWERDKEPLSHRTARITVVGND